MAQLGAPRFYIFSIQELGKVSDCRVGYSRRDIDDSAVLHTFIPDPLP